ncbi:terminase [Alkalibacillus sp. S2W]|uniref:terminase n=1 Tax=Alkalibacillus sp. S2W TaxID=3386553 RepID=UPI00398CD8E8
MAQVKCIDPFDTFEPHSFQEYVMECEARNIVIFTGRRGGKTAVAARKFYDSILADIEQGKSVPGWKKSSSKADKIQKPKLEYWCIAPYYSLTETQMNELSLVIPEEHIEDINLSKKYIYLKGDVLIAFKSADNQRQLVSRPIAGLWGDEGAKFKPTVWNGNLRQGLLDMQGWTIWTTTSEGKNWFYWDILTQGNWIDIGGDYEDFKSNKGYANFNWSSLDNDKVPGLREEVLEKMKEMPKRDIDREIFSRVDIFEGQVYDNFNKQKHVVKADCINDLIEQEEFKHYYIFKDWGFRNFGVSLLVGQTYDDKWYVIDEIYKKEINEWSDRDDEENWHDLDYKWYKKYNVKMVIADNSNPSAIKAYKKRKIKRIRPVEHSEKLVGIGIRAVRSFFHYDEEDETSEPKLYISEKCNNLLRELNTYKWKDNGEEEVVKKDDHGCDALRYGIYSLNNKKQPKRTIETNRNKLNQALGWD